MTTEKFIADIREFEAGHALKPADIKILETGEVMVTVDKSVLYQYNPSHNPLRAFWDWLTDSDDSFDPHQHAGKVAKKLQQNAQDEGIKVAARKRYKQLPIPYFSIPIPIQNSGTKVRDYSNLATQKIKISLTFPKDYDSQRALRHLVTAATQSDSLAGSIDLPTAARRLSWNPIKWVLHALSTLVPRTLARKMNRILPNKWIKATRPFEWGTRFSRIQINHGFDTSGIFANLINLGVIAPLTLWGGANMCNRNRYVTSGSCNNETYGLNSEGQANEGQELQRPLVGQNGISYFDTDHAGWVNTNRTDRMSLFAQTRTKLNSSSFLTYTKIDNALQSTFQSR